MEILVPLLFISLALAGAFLWAFLWANRTSQFSDLDSPGFRILMEERVETKATKEHRDGTKA